MAGDRCRVAPSRGGALMKGKALLSWGLMVAVPPALGAEEGARLVKKAPFPGSPQIAVVAEGDFEPRSIGSYSLRIYAGVSGQPTAVFPLETRHARREYPYRTRSGN